jgi:hypothetical protein
MILVWVSRIRADKGYVKRPGAGVPKMVRNGSKVVFEMLD